MCPRTTNKKKSLSDVSSILKINSFNSSLTIFFLRIGLEVEEELSHCNNCWDSSNNNGPREERKKEGKEKQNFIRWWLNEKQHKDGKKVASWKRSARTLTFEGSEIIWFLISFLFLHRKLFPAVWVGFSIISHPRDNESRTPKKERPS